MNVCVYARGACVRALPVEAASDSVTSGVIPTFNTVSIIPGIENFAPERTEMISGFVGSPKLRPKELSS